MNTERKNLIVLAREVPRCANPYCKTGVCFGPRKPKPHACKACAASANEVQ
jgi:hypothetical protein